jgi:hypothetical protein
MPFREQESKYVPQSYDGGKDLQKHTLTLTFLLILPCEPMTEQSFITCLNAHNFFDPCCDAPCPKHADPDDPCGIEQGSRECFRIACPTCTNFQEKENADKYTDENMVHEVKNITDGIFTDLDPENVGRPLLVVLIGDEGYYYRKSPAFDSDYESLIMSLNFVVDDLKECSQK